MAAIDDLAPLRVWLGVPATVVDDDALRQIVDAEALIQASLCRVPTDATTGDPLPLPADLTQALYRRVGREVAAKGVPLGIIGADAEYGPARLARWDSEVDRLEGPRRRFVFG